MKVVLLIACAGALAVGGCLKQQTVQQPATSPVAEQPPREPFPEQPAGEAQPAAEPQPAAPEPGTPAAAAWGWRVQIFVSSTVENARRVAEEARWKFGDQQVFIAETEPYYKVQIGANLDRQQADALKARARQLGYPQAYPVEVGPSR